MGSCKSQNAGDNSTVNNNTPSLQANVDEVVYDKPIHLTKKDFLEKVMDYEKNPSTWVFKGKLPCIIDFYADWCAPCKITSPILDELAKEYSGKIHVYKIDVQVEQELAAVFGVQGIPAFLYCPLEGNPSMASGIARTPEETKTMFKQNIESFLLKKTTSNL
ncbi:MAG: thiol reductase thioredoxin [Bacteroidales bacterium]|nr:thiol reductase thioredoxin [Bacteroidales bacterium]